MPLDISEFGTAIGAFLEDVDLPPLDAGVPNDAARADLCSLDVDNAFKDFGVIDEEMGRCCISGLLLLHGFLDESHRISQGVGSATGSYWHGIMHRREGDFSNAKYWFRNTGKHPIWPDLGAKATKLAQESLGNNAPDFLYEQAVWDPFKFVDLCEASVHQGDSLEQLCREIQMSEWETLFRFSFCKAIGRDD